MRRKKFLCRMTAALLSAAMVVTCTPINKQIKVSAAETERTQSGFEFGSTQTKLSVREYSLPVSLKNAGDITKDSMAASCVKDGRLTVNEDGTADITIGLQAVSIMSITAWAEQWKIYEEKDAGDENKEAAKYTTNEEGNIDSITFRLPSNTIDGVYTDMYVSAMNTTMSAYFAFDFSGIAAGGGNEGEDAPEKKTGSAKVEQFGGYDVNVVVSVRDGKIVDIEVEGSNFEGTYADYNKTKLQAAAEGLKASYDGKSATDAKEIEGVDAVSGATYSSNAIQAAVLDALGLEGSGEVITLPTEKLAEGTYEVDIAFYTDGVKHSLVENDKAKATVTVDANGTMTLTTAVVNGTEKEPLYYYDFNGYYEGNDANGALKATDKVKKEDVDFTDDVFGADEKVVTEVSFPLEGDFAAIYRTNASIYVPAMKNLTGEVGGITFDQGRFSSDCFAKVYWDSLKRVELPGPGSGSQVETLADGVYAVTGSMYKPDLVTKSMADTAFNHNIQMTVKDGRAILTMNFKGMAITGVQGYLGGLKYYGMGYSKDVNGNPTGTLKEVTVESMQKYSDGVVISDTYGKDYPDVVCFELIPEVWEDGIVPLQVFVPVMESITAGTGNQNVYLKLELDSLEKTTAEDERFKETEEAPENTASSSGTNTPSPSPGTGNNGGTNSPSPSTVGNGGKSERAVKIGQTMKEKGHTYKVTAKGKAAFTKCRKNAKSVTIPATVKINGITCKVTGVAKNAFKNNKKLTKVTLGKNVAKVGKKAFKGCKKLKTVKLPKGLSKKRKAALKKQIQKAGVSSKVKIK